LAQAAQALLGPLPPEALGVEARELVEVPVAAINVLMSHPPCEV